MAGKDRAGPDWQERRTPVAHALEGGPSRARRPRRLSAAHALLVGGSFGLGSGGPNSGGCTRRGPRQAAEVAQGSRDDPRPWRVTCGLVLQGRRLRAGRASLRGQEVTDLFPDAAPLSPIRSHNRPPTAGTGGVPGLCSLLRVRGNRRTALRACLQSRRSRLRTVADVGLGSQAWVGVSPVPDCVTGLPRLFPSQPQLPALQGGTNDTTYRAVERIKWDDEIEV